MRGRGANAAAGWGGQRRPTARPWRAGGGQTKPETNKSMDEPPTGAAYIMFTCTATAQSPHVCHLAACQSPHVCYLAACGTRLPGPATRLPDASPSSPHARQPAHVPPMAHIHLHITLTGYRQD